MTPDELTAYMERHSLSDIGLAKLLDTTRMTVNRWRRGQTPISRITAYALAHLETIMSTYSHSLGQHTITCTAAVWEGLSGETLRSDEEIRVTLDLDPDCPAVLGVAQDGERIEMLEGPEALRTFARLAWRLEHQALFTQNLSSRPAFLSALLKSALTTEARQHVISQRSHWEDVDCKSQLATLTGMSRQDVTRAFDGYLVGGIATLDALAAAMGTTSLDILSA